MSAIRTEKQSSSMDRVNLCVEAIKGVLPAEEIWLFGSQATNTASDGSDIDLLVVLPDNHSVKNPHLAAIRAISRLRRAIPADVVAIPHSAARSANPPVLAREAFAKGRKLYARAR